VWVKAGGNTVVEQVSASMTVQQVNPTSWTYSLTLNDIGTTSIGTFWFAWDDAPQQNFMASAPQVGSIGNPAGWYSYVTHGGASDGYGIEWYASSPIAAGTSVSGLSFTSGVAPSEMFAASAVDPNFQVTSSFAYAGSAFSDPGYQFAIACFIAGTRVTTRRGEVPVESLAIGDQVITVNGTARPIKWIGRRSYARAFVGNNPDIVPIRIAAGALADDIPARDLYVSPAHAMFIDGVLVPARNLIKGVSIHPCPEIDAIAYFHIELNSHDVIFAEGAPTETFVDCDSRGMFQKEAEYAGLYPNDAGPRWAFCAPRVEVSVALVISPDRAVENSRLRCGSRVTASR